jgi:hypothetical protein
MRADLLTAPVEGLDEALEAVAAFDDALTGGLLRPRPAQAAALDGLAAAVSGSPLAARTAEAAERAAAGAAGEEHLVALAAARCALLGSVHDALAARIAEATGRPGAPAPPAPAPEAAAAPPLAAARAWLAELARAGWRGTDHELVAGAAPVVSALLADPALRRAAVLLDGFAAELAASCPGALVDRVPVRRWADLWSRALLLTVPGALAAPAAVPVSGRLLPLGVDLQEHATAAQAQVHAVLEPADGSPARLVRAGAAVPKPDTVTGAGVWQLLRPHLSLLAAAGEGRCVELADMPLTPGGDLLWDEAHARPGDPAEAFGTARVALAAATDPAVPPLERHPARIAVPVLVEGHTAEETGDAVTYTVAGRPLRVLTDRVPAAGPLTPAAVAAATACLALLRWDDGEFVLQPLAVETPVKRRTAVLAAGAWAGGTTDKNGAKAEKAATDAVTVLRERAGRLLRK